MDAHKSNKHIGGLVRAGVEFEAAHRPEQAVEPLTEAVRIAPDNAIANLHLATVLADMGRFDEALPPLLKALVLRPDSAAFHLAAGRLHFDRMDHAAARAEFARTLELSPQNDLAQGLAVLNDWESGDVRAPFRLDPANLPDSDLFMARLLMLVERELQGREVRYEDKDCNVPLMDRPRIGWALWRTAGAMKRSDYDSAAEAASLVLEICPGHPAAAGLLQQCRTAALENARSRAAEHPDSAEAHLLLAQLLRDAEDYPSAARELAEACRLSVASGHADEANNPEIARLEGMILYGLGCPAEALERLNEGAEPGMTMPMTNYCLGLCHLALGRRVECLEAFAALVAQAWWAVPLRFREYLAWRRQKDEART